MATALERAGPVTELTAAQPSDLLGRVTRWIISYLERFYDANALTMNANLTSDLHFDPKKLPLLARASYRELKNNNAAWNVDFDKFSLDGTQMNDALLTKTLGELITYVYDRVKAAQLTPQEAV